MGQSVSLAWWEVGGSTGLPVASQTWVQYEKVFVGERTLPGPGRAWPGRAVPVGRCPYCSTHHLISARPVRLLPQITARSASLAGLDFFHCPGRWLSQTHSQRCSRYSDLSHRHTGNPIHLAVIFCTSGPGRRCVEGRVNRSDRKPQWRFCAGLGPSGVTSSILGRGEASRGVPVHNRCVVCVCPLRGVCVRECVCVCVHARPRRLTVE